MPVSSANRIGRLKTALGADELALLRFNGMDAVGDCFEYHVEAQATADRVNLDDLIGTHMTVGFADPSGGTIYHDGIVTEASWGGDDSGFVYHFTLRPWFQLLAYRTNHRIFQEMTVEDIFLKVCQDFPGDDSNPIQWNAAPGSVEEYIVQFGETDMHFLMRLLQRYGLNFHFEHEDGRHTLVVTDNADSFPMVAGDGGSREYIENQGSVVEDFEHFWTFTPGRRLTVGATYTTDYNFKTPTANMVGERTSTTSYANSRIERYIYPGLHLDQSGGTSVAQRRQEAMTARDAYFTASGNTMSMSSGMRVTLEAERHSGDVDGKTFICVKALHSYTEPGYRSGGASEAEAFIGSYEMALDSVPFLPAETATETKMPGPQTATVVGPGGDEIHVDEYGRIKVQFHWDRDGERDENSSMYIRVAQLWAGAGWGALFTPRIGMEVIVDFLEGDMNKPIVIGCVYNADNMPPYEQPGDKNWNGIKSNSTVGGGGYNEIVFNDTKGDELFRQHAQYDLETLVLNDERRTVNANRTTKIGGDEMRTVIGDETHEVKGDSTYTVKGDRERTIEGDHEHTVMGDEDRAIQGDQTDEVAGDRTANIQGDESVSAMGKIEITSMTSIELKCGASSIKLEPQKITVKSMDVEVAGTMNLKTNGGIMAEHSAGGIMTVKGALVKIN